MNTISLKNALLLVSIAGALLSSCSGNTQSDSDTDSTNISQTEDQFESQFTLQQFKYADSCEYAYVTCDVELPVNSSSVADKIRAFLCNELVKTSSNYAETKIKPYKDGNLVDIAQYCGVVLFDKLSEDSETQYLTSITENHENEEGDYEESLSTYKMTFGSEQNMTLAYENKNIVVFSHNSSIFLGGAHGAYYSKTYTFNAKTGEYITNILDKNKVKEMQPLLLAGIKKYFKELDPDFNDENVKEQLFIQGSVIPLPKAEPSPEAKGLRLTYECYEIAAYAAGEVSFVIPYDKVTPYLTKKAKQKLGL